MTTRIESGGQPDGHYTARPLSCSPDYSPGALIHPFLITINTEIPSSRWRLQRRLHTLLCSIHFMLHWPREPMQILPLLQPSPADPVHQTYCQNTLGPMSPQKHLVLSNAIAPSPSSHHPSIHLGFHDNAQASWVTNRASLGPSPRGFLLIRMTTSLPPLDLGAAACAMMKLAIADRIAKKWPSIDKCMRMIHWSPFLIHAIVPMTAPCGHAPACDPSVENRLGSLSYRGSTSTEDGDVSFRH